MKDVKNFRNKNKKLYILLSAILSLTAGVKYGNASCPSPTPNPAVTISSSDDTYTNPSGNTIQACVDIVDANPPNPFFVTAVEAQSSSSQLTLTNQGTIEAISHFTNLTS